MTFTIQVSIMAFMSELTILPFDSRAADCYGQIRASLEKAGTPIGPLDFQIAAIALAYDLPVVTNNVKEFQRIADLQVIDWLSQEG